MKKIYKTQVKHIIFAYLNGTKEADCKNAMYFVHFISKQYGLNLYMKYIINADRFAHIMFEHHDDEYSSA